MDGEAALETLRSFSQPALEPRTLRAIEECMVVLPVGEDTSPLYKVFSESGREYLVNLREERCECLDYRKRGVVCKHQCRARLKHDQRRRDETQAAIAESVATIDDRIADLEATITDLQRTRRQFQSLVDRLDELGPDPVPAERTGASAVAAPGDD